MPRLTIALDASARRIDADGRLHVSQSNISKAIVNPYYGSEIPGFVELGLEPGRIYHLLRDPEELAKGAGTFARLPILKKHQPITVDSPAPELVIGAIGSDVAFDAPYLKADLCFWDKASIAAIETGTIKELSCGYRYLPDMTPGERDGVRYDGVMREIKGNHLALVESGRAGSDVVVADSSPFKIRPMKMSKLGKALYVALCGMSPKIAADAACQLAFANIAKATLQRDDLRKTLFGLDAELSPERLDAVLDAILDVEQNPDPQATPAAAKDESPADKVRAMLAGKVDDETIAAICSMCAPAAADSEESEPAAKPDDVKAAMDSLRQEFKDAATAREDVRPVVGAVALDSAAEIYGFALDHMKVDRAGVTGSAALRALFKATHAASKPAPTVAQDAAGTAAVMARFPNAARFLK